MRTSALVLLPLLYLATTAASCDKVPIDSYCEKYQRKDFTDPGIRKQNVHNKRADLANENTFERDCPSAQPHDR